MTTTSSNNNKEKRKKKKTKKMKTRRRQDGEENDKNHINKNTATCAIDPVSATVGAQLWQMKGVLHNGFLLFSCNRLSSLCSEDSEAEVQHNQILVSWEHVQLPPGIPQSLFDKLGLTKSIEDSCFRLRSTSIWTNKLFAVRSLYITCSFSSYKLIGGTGIWGLEENVSFHVLKPENWL